MPVNPLCKDYTNNGSCTTCYPGYTLNQNICIVAKVTDPFCKSFTPGGICTSCYTAYYYNQGKAACQPLNPLCKSSNLADGSCTSCFPGYSLNSNGVCGVSFQDPNCQKFSNGACLQCATKYYLDTTGKCKQVNSLCKTADNNGACTSCYGGYIISGITCVVGGASNSDVSCQTV